MSNGLIDENVRKRRPFWFGRVVLLILGLIILFVLGTCAVDEYQRARWRADYPLIAEISDGGVKALWKHVPIGTPAPEVRRILNNGGFVCSWHHTNSVPISCEERRRQPLIAFLEQCTWIDLKFDQKGQLAQGEVSHPFCMF